MEALMRSPTLIRWWCTAPTARSGGMKVEEESRPPACKGVGRLKPRVYIHMHIHIYMYKYIYIYIYIYVYSKVSLASKKCRCEYCSGEIKIEEKSRGRRPAKGLGGR